MEYEVLAKIVTHRLHINLSGVNNEQLRRLIWHIYPYFKGLPVFVPRDGCRVFDVSAMLEAHENMRCPSIILEMAVISDDPDLFALFNKLNVKTGQSYEFPFTELVAEYITEKQLALLDNLEKYVCSYQFGDPKNLFQNIEFCRYFHKNIGTIFISESGWKFHQMESHRFQFCNLEDHPGDLDWLLELYKNNSKYLILGDNVLFLQKYHPDRLVKLMKQDPWTLGRIRKIINRPFFIEWLRCILKKSRKNPYRFCVPSINQAVTMVDQSQLELAICQFSRQEGEVTDQEVEEFIARLAAMDGPGHHLVEDFMDVDMIQYIISSGKPISIYPTDIPTDEKAADCLIKAIEKDRIEEKYSFDDLVNGHDSKKFSITNVTDIVVNKYFDYLYDNCAKIGTLKCVIKNEKAAEKYRGWVYPAKLAFWKYDYIKGRSPFYSLFRLSHVEDVDQEHIAGERFSLIKYFYILEMEYDLDYR